MIRTDAEVPLIGLFYDLLETTICVYLFSKNSIYIYCWKSVLYNLLIKALAKAVCLCVMLWLVKQVSPKD